MRTSSPDRDSLEHLLQVQDSLFETIGLAGCGGLGRRRRWGVRCGLVAAALHVQDQRRRVIDLVGDAELALFTGFERDRPPNDAFGVGLAYRGQLHVADEDLAVLRNRNALGEHQFDVLGRQVLR